MSNQGSMKDELKRRATWAILSYAIFRLESALTIALVLLLVFLYPNPFPWWRWWYWVIMGIVGEALIVYTSLRDDTTAQRVVADMLRARFNPRQIRSPKYRKAVEQALEYQHRIEAAIRDQRSDILRGYLQNSMLQITDWIANIFRLAKRLDEYEADLVLKRDREALPKQIQHAEARYKLEVNEAVRKELQKVMAAKRAQLANLENLQDVMNKAELQMDHSLSALGTLYSQLLLLDAKEVKSARARNIAQGIQDQVQALQNLVTTMDQVYGQAV